MLAAKGRAAGRMEAARPKGEVGATIERRHALPTLLPHYAALGFHAPTTAAKRTKSGRTYRPSPSEGSGRSVATNRTQKRAHACEGSGERASVGQALEGATLHRATTTATGTGANKGKIKAGPPSEGEGKEGARLNDNRIVVTRRARAHTPNG
jgi:hypothetical protein